MGRLERRGPGGQRALDSPCAIEGPNASTNLEVSVAGPSEAPVSGLYHPGAMNDAQLEAFRRMTPAERFELWHELARLGMDLWEANLDAAEIERRWSIWRREHDLSDQNMLRAFREAE